MAPDFKGLATEYPSFELLWFDIETKTRHLFEELVDPIIDKLYDHKAQLSQVKKEAQKHAELIKDLRETVYNTDKKLDIFEQINMKIA